MINKLTEEEKELLYHASRIIMSKTDMLYHPNYKEVFEHFMPHDVVAKHMFDLCYKNLERLGFKSIAEKPQEIKVFYALEFRSSVIRRVWCNSDGNGYSRETHYHSDSIQPAFPVLWRLQHEQ